jgi:hypothetical protein
MTAITELRLDAPEVTYYHIQGRQIWVKTDQYESVIRIPKVVRQSYWPSGDRAVIHAGRVRISGALADMQALWETICDTTPTK